MPIYKVSWKEVVKFTAEVKADTSQKLRDIWDTFGTDSFTNVRKHSAELDRSSLAIDGIKPPVKIRYVVGIDPGTNTGVAILEKQSDKVLHWCTQNFWSVIDFLDNTFPDKNEVKIVLEVPAAFLYDRNQAEEDFDERPDESKIKIRDRKMLNIGGVRRESQLLAQGLRLRGWTVFEVPPVRQTKWDSQKFRLYTKSHARANAHEMDATRLAFYYSKEGDLDGRMEKR